MPPLRREVPRQTINWVGEYSIEGDPEKRWRPCHVVDVSVAGAGLELLDAPSEVSRGERLTIAVRLLGEVRNAGPGRNDSLRVGVQFVELTPAERSYLDSLASLQARW